ncbi:protein-methionine-sulfoxide reductase catalytic subunit MsrP [Curvivirga aplysinae]|uniref:protein-methionine-sulfoxide reductase catalytic subunit MsrP n=1 Tax=Curvivirga aplysinae TaxID=2529852 RepID=UPI002E26AA25
MMLIKKNRGWDIKECHLTDESHFRNRRNLIKGLAAGSILAAGGGSLLGSTSALANAPSPHPIEDLFPSKLNPAYPLDRELTLEKYATSYCNFYEFGSSKNITDEAQAMKLEPWTITFDGMVENEKKVDVYDLIRQMPMEERTYRHRCVEAWSMAVPWTGFAMKSLIDFAKPLSGAKYVRMETLEDKDTMPGLSAFWYPWPYVEGLTIEEATNDLTFMATGIYGKPMPKQNGAPIRLVTPWKYGFKSIKSIVRITFTDERPVSYWEEIQASEYGFWANVNPDVPHPRWPQSHERVLGTNQRVPTMLYNGYGDYVADMYKNIKNEKLFM